MPRKKKPIEVKEAEWTDAIAKTGKDALGNVEGGISTVSEGVWGVFRDHPKVGTIVCGGLGLGGAMLIGVAELGATAVAGYFAYRMFAYGESLTEALRKTLPSDEA